MSLVRSCDLCGVSEKEKNINQISLACDRHDITDKLIEEVHDFCLECELKVTKKALELVLPDRLIRERLILTVVKNR